MFASWRTKSAFKKYSKVPASTGMTGAQAAQVMLERAGIYDVKIGRASGFLSDHYNPATKSLALSESVYDSNSIAAIGVATGTFTEALLAGLPNRLFGIMSNETLIAVPLFVFMGVTLERARIAEELLDTLSSLFGALRGGLGISVTIVGMLLAASTGIVGATVVTMGLLSLPTMLRRGYSPEIATGTICASGTLGQIIPPSIILVMLADVMTSAYQQAQIEMGDYAPKTL